MAAKGDALINMEDIQEDEVELSQEEQDALIAAFKKLGTKPKVSSPEDLRNWMARYVASTVKTESAKPLFPPATPRPLTTPKAGLEEGYPRGGLFTDRGRTPISPHSSFPLPPARVSQEISNYTPRISTFFGEPGKGEAPYDLWKFEVDSLRKSKIAPHIIEISVRRSLKGDAARVAMRLGADATLETLLQKLENTYGLSIQNDRLMEEFYSAKQTPDEDVIAWANRLEDLLYKACQRNKMGQQEINEKLCSMFWSGLDKKLKDTSGHLHYMIKDFDRLKKKMREHESDLPRESKIITSKMMTTKGNNSKPQITDSEIMATIQQMAADIQYLKDARDPASQQPPGGRGNWRGRGNSKNSNRGNYNSNRGGYNPGRGNSYSSRGNYNSGRGAPFQDHYDHSEMPTNTYGSDTDRYHSGEANQTAGSYNNRDSRQPSQNFYQENQEVVCYRCGQPGHIQKGCRVRLDHSRKAGLNFKRPA